MKILFNWFKFKFSQIKDYKYLLIRDNLFNQEMNNYHEYIYNF